MLLSEKTLNKIPRTYYTFDYAILDKDDNVINKHEHVACFKTIENFAVQKATLSNCKTLVLYFKDNVFNMFSPYSKVANKLSMRYINVLKKLGLFRNILQFKEENHVFIVSFDITVVSFREIFLVGSMFRMISEHPTYVYNFLKLKEKFPKEENEVLLKAASNVRTWRTCILPNNHTIYNSIGMFRTNKSIKDFLSIVDEKCKPFIKTPNYSSVKGVYTHISEFFEVHEYRDNPLLDVKPCQEVVDAVKSKKHFDEVVSQLRAGKFKNNLYPRSVW
jgi:hypothetical protein